MKTGDSNTTSVAVGDGMIFKYDEQFLIKFQTK